MSRYVDDSAELAKRLEDDIEAVISKYWPTWVKSRVKSQDVALLTPRIKDKQKRPTSSFTVNLSGDRRGQWYRFSQSVGGGSLALLFYGKHGNVPSSKSDWADAYAMAREFLGITQHREETADDRAELDKRRDQEKKDREDRDRRETEKRAQRDARRTFSAQEIWSEAQPLRGSQGEAYLVGRGIPPIEAWPWDCSNTLRFHPSLDYELDRTVGRMPAVVAAVLDPFGKLIAVWQIYMDQRKPVKAAIENPKVGRGPAAGGAVRVGGDAERVGGCEGLETGVAIWALEGFRMPIWPMLSTSGMMAFEPPIFLKRLSIFHDGDKGLFQNGRLLKPPGQNAGDVLAERMAAIGVGTNRNEMPILGDGLDLLQTRNEIERTK
ncbi:DUF7146 domain-containing protein [Rhizobium azibense]|uniref:DUF7146 domain-containing protein n=1 Tax=Rhizobium azibense TaxID=1136135 RepID=A0A4R3RGE6_9HYPH|nr:hypothetical protein [Rhizobium azibense]TCU34081.1 hypothetical protein EV129_11364 [Rhizobium azibense]